MGIIKNSSYFCLLLLVSLVTGCIKNPEPNQAIVIAMDRQQQLNHAKLLLSHAEKDNSPSNRQSYLLKAAEYFILADELNEAKRILSSIDTTSQNALYEILRAQLALNKQPKDSLTLLSNIWFPSALSPELQIKFYKTRATANLRLGNNLEAVRSHLKLDELLLTQPEKKSNSQEIWNILGQLTPHELNELNSSQHPTLLKGWLSFAHIAKQYDSSPAQLARAIALWKQQYPQHPAQQVIPSNIEGVIFQLPENPEKIALLLPLSGPYASSAETIKKGFLTAYYQQQKANQIKVEIKIYDTTISGGVVSAYNAATRDNADFLVGPLIKEDVETLYRHSTSIPILALNTIQTTSKPTENFFQFGLPPETEAVAIAEKSRQDGYKNALVVVPDNELGQRIINAFNSYWEPLDNKVIATVKVTEKGDFNSNIRKTLGIEASERRAQYLKRLGIKLNHEPRRRQDVDVIFLATSPTIARQIKPLLNFHYAGSLPIYASSSIYTGKPAPSYDQDLNGIKFCDMPWILDRAISLRSNYTTIAKLWPNELNKTPRLFALGIDAYNLTTQIQRLGLFPDFGISGMTGVLKLDSKQRIQRQFMWATFRNGKPIVK